MVSSQNVSKMYFDLYLHINVLIDDSVSNSARHLIADFI